jgi:murein DD-endopeptidase MepM/ murein hydrolase activator NlpD
VPSLSIRARRLASIGLSALLLLTLSGPTGTVGADRWERQRDDPIAVARRQREAIHGRIETQAERLARLKASTKALNGRIERTTNRLQDITSSLADVEAEVAAARAELARTQAQHDVLVDEVRLLDWSLDQLTAQADELSADLQERRRALGNRLAEAYRTGKTAVWEQVIDADSFVDVMVVEGGLIGFAEHDQAVAAGIEQDQVALDVRRRDIRQLRYETDQLRAAVAASADELKLDRDKLLAAEERLAERRATTAQLREEQQAQFRKMARTKEQVADLLAQQRRQAERLTGRIKALLEKERHAGRLPSAYNGTFRWPLIGRISQEFGCTGFALEPGYGDCAHFHRGIDIVRTYGAPVVAAGDGVVLFVGFDPDEPRSQASWSVVIGHSTRLITTYGHLIPRAPDGIRAGMRVRAGQTIGWMGNTGKSTGAHLHWGVWLDGEPVNPRYFL